MHCSPNDYSACRQPFGWCVRLDLTRIDLQHVSGHGRQIHHCTYRPALLNVHRIVEQPSQERDTRAMCKNYRTNG